MAEAPKAGTAAAGAGGGGAPASAALSWSEAENALQVRALPRAYAGLQP